MATCLEIYKKETYIHDDGNDTYIYVGRTWTYEIKRQDNSYITQDETVYLSYAGSTVSNGIEFSGPTSVVIQENNNSVEFEITINIHENAYHKFLYISGTSLSSNSCGTAINQILSYDSTPDGIDNIDYGPSCCGYVPKNYIPWSDGIGLKTLIPPNKR